MRDELSRQSRVCKSLLRVQSGADNALDWVLRDFLGECQPAAAWVVQIVGSRPDDSRDFTLTLHATGDIEDPTFAYERDGIPGPAAAFALETAWTRSSDPRFHPMDRRWSHKNFWLSTLSPTHLSS